MPDAFERGDAVYGFLTKEERQRLIENGCRRKAGEDALSFTPVVMLITPDAGCSWLLSEIDPEQPDIAFGLCDLGMGYPELGTVSLSELARVRGSFGLPVERFPYSFGDKTIGQYAIEARIAGHALGNVLGKWS